MKKERPWRMLQVLDFQPCNQYLAENGNFLKPVQIFEATVNVSIQFKQHLVSSLEKEIMPKIEFYNRSGNLERTSVVYLEEDSVDTSRLRIYVPLTRDQELSFSALDFSIFEGN